MKIWDTFLFSDELDMLECRLRELDRTGVYRHVLVESRKTFTGREKPLWYADHRERFGPWADRIIHVIADAPGVIAWDREYGSRETIQAGLGGAEPDDFILMSDVDEIPEPWGIRAIPENFRYGVSMIMKCTVFAVDWLHPELSWRGTAGSPLRQIQRFQNLRGGGGLPPLICGWHMSWLGGDVATMRKACSFSHVEMRDEILRGINEGRYLRQGRFWGWHGQEQQLLAVDVDDTWPRWVRERRCPASWFRPREEGTSEHAAAGSA